MAQPETLTAFLDYGYTTCDADYYSLILWNHGSDALSLQEMDTAFRNTQLICDGKRFEWVGFDACLMGMVEVANMLSDYANYLIASEETESGTGWDYTCLDTLSDGAHCDGLAASQEIIRTYKAFQETKFRFIPDYTLSAMDLSKVDSVITALEALVEAAQADLIAGNYSRIAKLRDQAKTFGKATNTSIYDTVDLYDLCGKLVAIYPNEATALQQAVKELVVCHATNVYGAHGVAVYFPYENKEYAAQWLQVYETTDFSPVYTAFIRDFTDTLSGKQLAQWDIAEIAPVESTITPGEYYVQLTAQQAENFSRAKYSIWEAEENRPGSYICWINSSDVHLSEDGKVSTGFEGKRFFLCDTSGNSLGCTAFESERNDEYVKYVIPIIYRPINEDGFSTAEAAYLHVRVDEAHPEGRIIGIYQDYTSNSTMFPNRDLVEIGEGTIVSPFLYTRAIVFREDGSVAPFEEWESTLGIANDFRVSGELGICLKTGEPGTEYCCLISITDTQGNTYFTNPIYFNQ